MRFVLGDSRLLVRDILPGHILDSSSHGISGIIPRATSLKYFAESTVHLLTVLFIFSPFRPQSTFTLAPSCINSILVAELAYVQYIVNHEIILLKYGKKHLKFFILREVDELAHLRSGEIPE